MIVDDQSFQREYLRNLFREQSVVGMHAVENGAEALRWLEQERFDLSQRHADARLDRVQLIQRPAALGLAPLLTIMSSAPCLLMGSGCSGKK